MFLSIGMLKQKYFLTDIFILSAEKQPIKLSWRKIEWLPNSTQINNNQLLNSNIRKRKRTVPNKKSRFVERDFLFLK